MRIFNILLIFNLILCSSYAQEKIENYRRSSLYSILITHSERNFGQEIKEVYYSIPIPEKFDDHNLSVRVIDSNKKKDESETVINHFIEKNKIARRMMSKWFDRDPETGIFSMDLITERGHYDATYSDINEALASARGTAMIADAGEELIGNTFLLINDISYVDRGKGTKIAGGIFRIAGTVGGLALGSTHIINTTGNLSDVIESIKGFKVTVTSYLYRLEWNEEIAGTLYHSYYMTENQFDPEKKNAFENDANICRLKYIGKQSVNSGETSMRGIETPRQMIQKVCARAIDMSIVELQKAHEEFRVKTPLFNVETTIQAKIGMKEGLTSKSKFEVLEQSLDKNGKTNYKRVGIIQPIADRVWDNRYMAQEEKADGADLTYTEFKKISGGDFYPGMLIREIE